MIEQAPIPSELQDLIDFEDTMERIVLITPKFKILDDFRILRNFPKCKVEIRDGEKLYTTTLNDQFISQIVLRIYEKDESYVPDEHPDEHVDIIQTKTPNEAKLSYNKADNFSIQLRQMKKYLHYNLETDLENFILKIEKELIKINVFVTPSNKIYGFVSGGYKITNQIDFRDQFINLCSQNDTRFDFSKSIIEVKNDRITEFFDFRNGECDILLRCGLNYGKNNGYGAYSILWMREFKDTKAKLLPFKTEDKYRWQNNPRLVYMTGLDISSFVQSVTQEGTNLMEICDKIIANAKSDLINPTLIMDTFDTILDKVLVAKSSKERVKNYYKENYLEFSNDCKDNMWAIAHTLCFTGTNNKAIPLSMRDLLIKLGTELLVDGFEIIDKSYKKDGISFQIIAN
jgi:hypothetical protein